MHIDVVALQQKKKFDVLNIRYLLKQKKIAPDQWAEELSRRTKPHISVTQAHRIIAGSTPSDEDLEHIADAFGRELEELRVAPIFGRGEDTVLKENLAFLRKSLPHGGKKALAVRLGIKQSTISHWGKQIEEPEQKNLDGTLRFFGIDPGLVDLHKDPLFLTLHPIGGHLQKKWLKDQLDDLPAEELKQYFPALERILRKDEKN